MANRNRLSHDTDIEVSRQDLEVTVIGKLEKWKEIQTKSKERQRVMLALTQSCAAGPHDLPN